MWRTQEQSKNMKLKQMNFNENGVVFDDFIYVFVSKFKNWFSIETIIWDVFEYL